MTAAQMRALNIYVDFMQSTPMVNGWRRYDVVMHGSCVIGYIETVHMAYTSGERVVLHRTHYGSVSIRRVDLAWLCHHNRIAL